MTEEQDHNKKNKSVPMELSCPMCHSKLQIDYHYNKDCVLQVQEDAKQG